MKLRFPARTTLGLPLTGARRYSTDAASAREATRAETAGETVLMSTSTVPGRAAAMTLSATVFERLVVRERREDHVDLPDEILGRGRNDGTPSPECVRLLPRSIGHDERIAGVEKALCDRRAHVAETDQPHGGTRVVERRALSSMNKRSAAAGQATSTVQRLR